MIEDNIESFNVKETFLANALNSMSYIPNLICLLFGLKIIANIQDIYIQVFGLIVIITLFLKYFRFRVSIVYNKIFGGLIKYD